jgi:hypothetical protein
MGNGRNHNFVIQTRQKDDELFRLKEDAGPISAAGTVAFPIRRVLGYGSIRFLAISTEILRLRIEEAPAPEGPWVETVRLTAVASPSGSGQFFICTDVSPCSVFMRIFLDNTGAGAAPAELSGFGHPVAGGGGGGGGGGGSPSVVELEDGNGGTTRASVKLDGTPINGQGSVLAGGRDPGGAQRALAVNAAGQLVISIGTSTPGTSIITSPDTVVGIGATVPLPAPPVGTTRMTVQNTGPSGSVIRVRELGGPAGAGIKLVIFSQETYGGEDGAIAPLEVQEVAGIATSVCIQFEGP